MAEEVGHGDQAAADDAGGDFGDTSIIVGSVFAMHARSRARGRVKAHVHIATGNR